MGTTSNTNEEAPKKKKHTGGKKEMPVQMLRDRAVEIAKEYKCFFLADVEARMPCKHQTFFNKGLNKYEPLLAIIEANKIQVKTALRKKWLESTAPATQIALYRLICSAEERESLSLVRHEVTGKDGAFEIKNLPPGDYTLVAWHEALGASAEQKVTIGPKETKTVDFTFKAQ